MNGQQDMNTDKFKRFFSGKSTKEELKEISDKMVADKSFSEKILFYKKLHNSFEEIHHENDAELLKGAYKKSLSAKENQELSEKKNNKKFAQKEALYNQLRASIDAKTNSKKIVEKQQYNSYSRLYKTMSAAAAILLAVVCGDYFMSVSTQKSMPGGAVAVTNFVYQLNADAYEKYKDKNKTDQFEQKIKEPKGDIAVRNTIISKETKTEIELLIEEYVQKIATDDNITLMACADAKNITLPSSYSENLFLSNLATVNLRSENTQTGFITSPKNLEIIKTPFTIKFNKEMIDAHLTINNNNKEEIWSAKNITQSTLMCPIEIPAGTYYFVLKQKNNKPQILQFFITK